MSTDTSRRRPKVLLAELAIRTSSTGKEYLTGWLGKSKLIAFKAAERDRYGNEVWQVYAQEPEPRPNESAER